MVEEDKMHLILTLFWIGLLITLALLVFNLVVTAVIAGFSLVAVGFGYVIKWFKGE